MTSHSKGRDGVQTSVTICDVGGGEVRRCDVFIPQSLAGMCCLCRDDYAAADCLSTERSVYRMTVVQSVALTQVNYLNLSAAKTILLRTTP